MMNDWLTLYREKKVSLETAVATIQSEHNIFLAPFCNEPQTLVSELIQQRERLKGATLYNVIVGSPSLYAVSDNYKYFKIRSFLSSSKLKKAFLEGDCDYIPLNLSEIPEWISHGKMDVAMIQVTPPNKAGFCNLGISVDVVPSLVKHATVVIAEVNEDLPWTNGETQIHVSNIDYFVESKQPLLSIPNEKPNDTELKIGHYVAELIPDYATIQLGVGKVANSIMLALKDKRGLGIHSGSIIDAVIDLIEMGVITNERKEIDTYQTVCTALTGSDKLYRYCHENEGIQLLPADYTHNAAVISKISNFYAINSSLEVDIFGQINAEQVSSYPVAGVGGQMDFIQGAKLSQGGKSIIALPSTAKQGLESRIKAKIPYVTSVKSDIDYVVTEYGIASLHGKSLKERAKQLIAIAHPDFREELSESLF